MNYSSTGQLQQFVVTADTTDTAGSMTIPFEPAIVPDGNLQSVTGSPGNGAAVVVLGSVAGGRRRADDGDDLAAVTFVPSRNVLFWRWRT